MPSSGTLVRFEPTHMKARRFLALIVALVGAAAVLVLFLVAAISSPTTDSQVDSSDTAESILDGWANRDKDIGTF